MRLFLGLQLFLLWSAGSGYWYVCKVKGLCWESPDVKTALAEVSAEEALDNQTLPLENQVEKAPVVEEQPDPERSGEEDSPEELPTEEKLPPGEIPSILAQPYTVLFSYAKPRISDSGAIEVYMADAAAYLGQHPGARLKVVGYTDDTAARQKNKELGQKRAEVIADMLEEVGVSRGQMDIESKGEADPVATNETPAGRKRNRRVEISLVP